MITNILSHVMPMIPLYPISTVSPIHITQRLGDPYGNMLDEEVMGVEEHSTGEEVGSLGLRGKPRKLVVRPKEGDVLVGR